MQISGESNGLDLSAFTLSKLGGLTTADYTLAAQVRAMNQAQHIIWPIIFEAYGGWQFDDSNQGSGPTTTASLSANVDITLPSAALTIRGVSITNSTTGTSTKLVPATLDEIQQFMAFGEFQKTDAIPQWYVPIGGTLFLKPQLSSSVTDSYTYTVYYDQGMVNIAYNATTATPGFASEFHEALAVYAALDFAKSHPNGMENRIASLQNDWTSYVGIPERGIKGSIARFYAKRWAENFPPKINIGQSHIIEDYE